MTRVLLIGPTDHATALESFAQGRFPDLSITTLTYADETDARRLLAENWKHYNVALFTGPGPYFAATDGSHPPIPCFFVPFTGASLFRALFKVQRSDGYLDGVSIDSVDRAGVHEVLDELELSNVEALVLEYKGFPSRADIVRFHMEAQDTGAVKWALTGLRSAYDELSNRGYRVVRIVPPKSTWLAALRRAQDKGELWVAKRHQLAAVLIDHSRGGAGADGTEVQAVAAYLRRVETTLDSRLLRLSGDRSLLFTSRGLVDDQLSGGFPGGPLTGFPAELAATSPVVVGVGMGVTAAQAYEHAETAVDRGCREVGAGVFVVDDSKAFTGPVGELGSVSFSLRSVSPRIARYAESCGIGVAQMERVMAAMARLGSVVFNANELAPLLGTSPRHARRVLGKLERAHLVRAVGAEKVYARGRPRRLFVSQLEDISQAGMQEVS